MDVALIDYGASNLHSVAKALEHAGFKVILATEPEQARNVPAMVLPGQGHFGQVMTAFLNSGFETAVRQHIKEEKPFLGICVGLQLLMERSEEAPDITGLGIIKGETLRFPEGQDSVPQMGWNQLEIVGEPALLKGIAQDSFVYYCNSYYVSFDEDLPGAKTNYAGISFKSAVSKGHLNATQFHPEKSQTIGLSILKNFKDLSEELIAARAQKVSH
ncbi:MAG: imidazole glycerol phosphate synthase subunit HisH [Trueperaceae bacterium]|nr:imidazole glycerol phosphate synthase subunit HisH [Trueperaceae bacterium]